MPHLLPHLTQAAQYTKPALTAVSALVLRSSLEGSVQFGRQSAVNSAVMLPPSPSQHVILQKAFELFKAALSSPKSPLHKVLTHPAIMRVSGTLSPLQFKLAIGAVSLLFVILKRQQSDASPPLENSLNVTQPNINQKNNHDDGFLPISKPFGLVFAFIVFGLIAAYASTRSENKETPKNEAYDRLKSHLDQFKPRFIMELMTQQLHTIPQIGHALEYHIPKAWTHRQILDEALTLHKDHHIDQFEKDRLKVLFINYDSDLKIRKLFETAIYGQDSSSQFSVKDKHACLLFNSIFQRHSGTFPIDYLAELDRFSEILNPDTAITTNTFSITSPSPFHLSDLNESEPITLNLNELFYKKDRLYFRYDGQYLPLPTPEEWVEMSAKTQCEFKDKLAFDEMFHSDIEYVATYCKCLPKSIKYPRLRETLNDTINKLKLMIVEAKLPGLRGTSNQQLIWGNIQKLLKKYSFKEAYSHESALNQLHSLRQTLRNTLRQTNKSSSSDSDYVQLKKLYEKLIDTHNLDSEIQYFLMSLKHKV